LHFQTIGMAQPPPFGITTLDGPTPLDQFYQDILEQSTLDDFKFAVELIGDYKTTVSKTFRNLEELLAQDRPFSAKEDENAQLWSHDIKGSSSYIGGKSVYFVSAKTELLCKDKKYKEARKMLPELKYELDALFQILDDYVAAIEQAEAEAEEELG